MSIDPGGIVESLIHNVNSRCSSIKGVASLLRKAAPGERRELLALMAQNVRRLDENIARFGAGPRNEAVYVPDHPELVEWIARFERRAQDMGIYSAFEAASPRSRERAIVVGALWHRFSSFMPWFLCQSAAMVSSNEKRHYVIQTAFEELGMRDVREIHPDMFWSAAETAGLDRAAREDVLAEEGATRVLSRLRETLLGYRSDEEVLGILLGLEVSALPNIDALFGSLAHTDELAATLGKHKFFRLHRQIEQEHVRMTVGNFLRFCATPEQKARFDQGFNDGLDFWRGFWASASALIASRTAAEVANA